MADPERLRIEVLPDGTKLYIWQGAPPRVRSGEIWVGPPYQATRSLDA